MSSLDSLCEDERTQNDSLSIDVTAAAAAAAEDSLYLCLWRKSNIIHPFGGVLRYVRTST